MIVSHWRHHILVPQTTSMARQNRSFASTTKERRLPGILDQPSLARPRRPRGRSWGGREPETSGKRRRKEEGAGRKENSFFSPRPLPRRFPLAPWSVLGSPSKSPAKPGVWNNKKFQIVLSFNESGDVYSPLLFPHRRRNFGRRTCLARLHWCIIGHRWNTGDWVWSSTTKALGNVPRDTRNDIM